MTRRAQRRPAAHAEAHQTDGHVPVAPYGLVGGPGGVVREMRLVAVPAAVAVVDDMRGQLLLASRAGQPAPQAANPDGEPYRYDDNGRAENVETGEGGEGESLGPGLPV